MRCFVDTWGWIALGNSKEPRHKRAVQFVEELQAARGILVTTDYILDETLTLLFVSQPANKAIAFFTRLLESAATGRLMIECISVDRFSAAWALRKKYRDKPKISFTDLTSCVVMKELGISTILTEDAHFLQVGLGFELVE